METPSGPRMARNSCCAAAKLGPERSCIGLGLAKRGSVEGSGPEEVLEKKRV